MRDRRPTSRALSRQRAAAACGFEALSGPGAPPDLQTGRAHEISGGLARAFAAAQIGLRRGPALWVLGPRARARLDPYGLTRFFDPARLVLVDAPKPIDIFWAMEEALRSGAAPVVVGEAPDGAGLTAGRRLQLAAEAGGATGLLLVGLDGAHAPGGANAAETRWRVEPAAPGLWRAALLKNKRGAPGEWILRWRPRTEGDGGDGRRSGAIGPGGAQGGLPLAAAGGG